VHRVFPSYSKYSASSLKI